MLCLFGGYGTFGAHVARALAASGATLVIAGRDGERAAAFASALGPSHRSAAADARDASACRAALDGCIAALSCAGPFGALDTTLARACLDRGCHYADIADDRAYVASVRALDSDFRRADRAAIFGCSSLPGISGALALALQERRPAKATDRARITLFIGNDNPKGMAAIASAVSSLGRTLETPQGPVRGFGDGEVVPLPAPFGRRRVYNFDAPELDLFPGLLGIDAVSVKVGFEMRLATAAFALLARIGTGYGARTASLLHAFGGLGRSIGCSGGAVMVELLSTDGTSRRAVVWGEHDAQRMAALPCAFAGVRLASGPPTAAGVQPAYEALGGKAILDGLVAAGYRMEIG